jgi:hypothetical protein
LEADKEHPEKASSSLPLDRLGFQLSDTLQGWLGGHRKKFLPEADVLLQTFLYQASAGKLRIVTPHTRSFEACTIDRADIRDEQEALRWEEMEKMTIEKGNISALTRTPGEGE